MTFGDLLRDTLATLWAQKLRTLLTMFGIAWGIVSITLMIAAGEGLSRGYQIQMENVGKDIMIVWAGRTGLQAGGERAGRKLSWRDGDAETVAMEAHACRYILPELGSNRPVRSSFNAATVLVTASYPPFAEIRSIGIAEGRFYDWEDVRQRRRVVFLGSDLTKQLFAGRAALGQTVYIGGLPYAVIGTMKAKEQDNSYDGRDVNKAFVPFPAMLRDFPNKPPQRSDSLDNFIVQPKSLAEHRACESQLRAGLARIHHFDPLDKDAVPMWDTIENAQSFRKMTDGMKGFLGAVGVTTLFLGGIGVMNVMLVSVRERTREIGIRKAVGATQRSIVGQIFAETCIITGLSGLAGFAAGQGFCALVNTQPMPAYFAGLVADWRVAVASFVTLAVIAVLSALYPAAKAAAVDPIEALRFEAGG